MTTHAEWAISRLENGEKFWGVFDYRNLATIRQALEARYKSCPTEIRISRGMMELTPTEAFIKREQ